MPRGWLLAYAKHPPPLTESGSRRTTKASAGVLLTRTSVVPPKPGSESGRERLFSVIRKNGQPSPVRFPDGSRAVGLDAKHRCSRQAGVQALARESQLGR